MVGLGAVFVLPPPGRCIDTQSYPDALYLLYPLTTPHLYHTVHYSSLEHVACCAHPRTVPSNLQCRAAQDDLVHLPLDIPRDTIYNLHPNCDVRDKQVFPMNLLMRLLMRLLSACTKSVSEFAISLVSDLMFPRQTS